MKSDNATSHLSSFYMEDKLQLEDIVLIGRTFDEYAAMFDLDPIELQQREILDIASGVSSFNVEAAQKGVHVTSSDRIYAFSPEEIEKKCTKDLEMVMEKLPSIAHLYKWEFFKNIEELKSHREKAYKSFVEDFKKKKGISYIPVEYPQSPFADNQFTLSLVSHFLFLYDEHLDYTFHKNTILEILRVTAEEIRIFPTVNLAGKRSSMIDTFLQDETFHQHDISIKKVDYEFVKGGNEVLIIKKNPALKR